VPTTTIIFFRDEDGSAPFLDWFGRLPEKAKVQCRARLGLLADRATSSAGRLRTTSVTESTS
jgi:hypothetical protein